MRNPGGYAFITNPEPGKFRLDERTARPEDAKEGVIEFDSFTCGHCGTVRHVRAKERPEDTGGLCKQCMKLICPHCLNTGRCDPLEKKIEEMEKRNMALRSYGL